MVTLSKLTEVTFNPSCFSLVSLKPLWNLHGEILHLHAKKFLITWIPLEMNGSHLQKFTKQRYMWLHLKSSPLVLWSHTLAFDEEKFVIRNYIMKTSQSTAALKSCVRMCSRHWKCFCLSWWLQWMKFDSYTKGQDFQWVMTVVLLLTTLFMVFFALFGALHKKGRQIII